MYRFEVPSRVAAERSYVIRSTRVEEPAGGFLCSKKNFCFGDALHGEDVRILRSTPFCRGSRTAIVHFLGTIGLSGSLSLLVLSLESPTIRLDVSGLLAVVADPLVTGLAPIP